MVWFGGVPVKGVMFAPMDRPEHRLIRSPGDAEVVAADWLRYFGYVDATVTAAGADGGVDVESSVVVAQVKAEMKPTGRPVVQQIFGIASLRGAQAAVFSLAGFTSEAADWANEAGVALFQFDMQGDPEPLNSHSLTVVGFAAVEINPDTWRADLDRHIDEFGQSSEASYEALSDKLTVERKVGNRATQKKAVAQESYDRAVRREALRGARLWSLIAELDQHGYEFSIAEVIARRLEHHSPSYREYWASGPDPMEVLEALEGQSTVSHMSQEDTELLQRHSEWQ